MSENNFLSPLNFKFVLKRTPNVEYTIQSVLAPGVGLSQVATPTPFVPLYNAGTVNNGDLHVRFKVGENMSNYLELLDWINTLGHPDSLSQFEDLKSDCSIIVMNSSRQPNIEFKYTDAWPYNIGPLSFDTTITDVQYVTVDVSFKFNRFYINLI